jgi:hypothetical protein
MPGNSGEPRPERLEMFFLSSAEVYARPRLPQRWCNEHNGQTKERHGEPPMEVEE